MLLLLSVCGSGCGGKAVNEGTSNGSESATDDSTPLDTLDSNPASGLDCVDGILGASKVRGLRAALSVDAVSFVILTSEHLVSGVVEQWGEACPDDGVGSICLLNESERMTGFYLPEAEFGHALIVSMRGEHNALGYWTIRDFLGDIDTANEASLLAWTEGWVVDCLDLEVQDGGYVFETDDDCAPDGRVTISVDGLVSHSAHCR